MKTFILTLIIAISVAGNLFAQEQKTSTKIDLNSISERSLCQAEKGYYNALVSNNEGMIESALSNIMIMKIYFSDRNYDKFILKLTELSTEGKSKLIRYKSYIACNYLKHPERYTWLKKDNFKDTLLFFNFFSDKLAKQLKNTENNLLVFSK